MDIQVSIFVTTKGLRISAHNVTISAYPASLEEEVLRTGKVQKVNSCVLNKEAHILSQSKYNLFLLTMGITGEAMT